MTATGTMLGYKVVRETMEIPKMGKRFEVWRAPDLNCAELRTDVFALEPPGGKATLQHTPEWQLKFVPANPIRRCSRFPIGLNAVRPKRWKYMRESSMTSRS
jgi:hypothetical protein